MTDRLAEIQAYVRNVDERAATPSLYDMAWLCDEVERLRAEVNGFQEVALRATKERDAAIQRAETAEKYLKHSDERWDAWKQRVERAERVVELARKEHTYPGRGCLLCDALAEYDQSTSQSHQ